MHTESHGSCLQTARGEAGNCPSRQTECAPGGRYGLLGLASHRLSNPWRGLASLALLATLAATTPLGCRRGANAPQVHAEGEGEDHDHDHEHGAEEAPSNRVAIPDAVRRSLGITFAKAERHDVRKTLRVPGRFELEPLARREYRAATAGRVTLAVNHLARITKGDVLFRLDAPGWRELQERIAAAESEVAQAEARLGAMEPLMKAHAEHERSLASKAQLWADRVAQLEAVRAAGGGKQGDFMQAQAVLRETEAELADVREKDAELEARRAESVAELHAARTHQDLLLRQASALTDRSVEELGARDAAGIALWHSLGAIEVRADVDGVVEDLAVTNGAHIDAMGLALSVVQPERVRFRAFALQADLARLRDGMEARIVPPTAAIATHESVPATVTIGVRADPDERTAELIAAPGAKATWARAGVAGFLDITLESGGGELAVPSGAIVRDGVTPILFRRDPKDPDTVIRLTADIGPSDGRWTTVLSGLAEGDEVVLDGVYPLLLATSGNSAKGGHFHSDGTFHEGKH